MRALLPATWSMSPVVPDYGVDLRTEVFEGGAATGLTFGVQLKGTDAPDLRKALKRQVDVSALNYMSAWADPVMLVLYHAPSGALYGRWLYRQDVVLKRAEQKTYTVEWTIEDLLGVASPETMADEVRRFRRLTRSGLPGVSATVRLEGPVGVHPAALAMLLTAGAGTTGGFLDFDGVAPHDVDVLVTPATIRVDMSVASILIESRAPSTAPDLAANVLVGCAVCLAKVGRPDVAARLVAAMPTAPLLENEQVAGLLAAAFATAGHWREASDLARGLRGPQGGPSFLAAALGLQLHVHTDLIPDGDVPYVAENLLGQALDADEAQKPSANLWYSAANYLFHEVHDYPAALAAYEQAGLSDGSDYDQQEYFLSELAAAQFEVGQFDRAVDTYGRAIAMGGADSRLLACRADALVYAGRYLEAAAGFAAYEAAADNGNARSAPWRLKATALDTIVGRVEGAQQRTPADDRSAPDDLRDDGLSPTAWLALAEEAGDAGEDRVALDAFVVLCAFPAYGLPEPWHIALAGAHALGLADLFGTLVDSAWSREGDGLVPVMLQMAPGVAEVAGFLDALKARLDVARSRARPAATVRFVQQDGRRETVMLNPEADA